MAATEKNEYKDIFTFVMSARKTIPAGYQQHFFTHLLCQQGKGHFQLNNKVYKFEEGDIVILLPSVEVTNMRCSRNFQATSLCISFDLMSKNNPDIGWGIKAYLFSKDNPVVHLSKADAEKCENDLHLLQEKYDNDEHRFKNEIVNLQLQMFVMNMWNIFSKEIEKRRISDQKGSLFERFLQLVEEYCMEERETEFYAAKLFITPKYLTEVSKKNSGKTASQWIQNYTTQRLIILLQNKALSFTQIADTLNFSSQSFFSRYVRRVLGVSPSEYRLRMAAL